MHITLDTYPNSGGCVLHLANHEIEEILWDLAAATHCSASTDELYRQLEDWMKGRNAQS